MFPFVLGKDFSPEQTVLRNTDHWRPKRRHSTYTILEKKIGSWKELYDKRKIWNEIEKILELKIEYFYEQILFNLLKYSNFIVNKILIRYEALLRIRLHLK